MLAYERRPNSSAPAARMRSRASDVRPMVAIIRPVVYNCPCRIVDRPSSKDQNMESRKAAVITGASQGIGAGLVRAYLDLGYAVVANSRSIAPSTEDGLVTVAGDIPGPGVAERGIATATSTFGRVDALVNNAGVFIAKPFTDYTQE